MKAFCILIVLLFSFQTYAHEYYFAFAEVKYNDISQKLETTLTASTHDLELAMAQEKLKIGEIEKISLGSNESLILEDYLMKHFKITTSSQCHLTLIGFEVQLNGVTNFYFESGKVELKNDIVFSFDLLMKQHQNQQNKVTFYHRNKTYTSPFLYDNRIQTIKLYND